MNMHNEVLAFYKKHADKIRMEFQDISERVLVTFTFRPPYDKHLSSDDVYEDIKTEKEPKRALELRAALSDIGLECGKGYALTHGAFVDFQNLFQTYAHIYVAEILLDRTIAPEKTIGFWASFTDVIIYVYPIRGGYRCEEVLMQVAYAMSKTFSEFYQLEITLPVQEADDTQPFPDLLKHTTRIVWKPNYSRVFAHHAIYSAREGRGEITFTFSDEYVWLLESRYFDTNLTHATICTRDGNILRCAHTAPNEFRALRIDEDVCDAFARVLCRLFKGPVTHELFDHPTYSWNLELPDVLPPLPTAAPKPKLSLLQKLRAYFRI